MAVVGSAILELLGDSAQFRAEMSGAARHFEAIGARLQSVGATLTKAVTLPIVGIGVAAGKAFIDFESSFAGIRKTLPETEAGFQRLAQANRDLAKTIPVSVNELNRIGELAGQLGIRGVDNILKFEDTIAKLAVTTDLTAEQGALAFAQIANILQLPQDQIDRLGSAVVGLGNNFATTESKIVDFTQRIAGAGKLAGLSVGDITGIATAFSSLGIEAEAGGTAVQKVLISMVTAVTQGGEELNTFAKVSELSAAAFAEAFRKDPGAAFTKFVEGLGKQGNAAINTLEELGLQDQRLVRAFLGAAGAGELLSRAIERGNIEVQANNALTAEAAKRFETAQSRITIFWNRIKDVAITLGGALVPLLLDTIDAMQPLINLTTRLVDAFSNLPKPLRAAIVVFAGTAAAMGPLLVALGTLAKLAPVAGLGLTALVSTAGNVTAFVSLAAGVRSVSDAFTLLRFAMGPVSVAILGISAAIAAITAGYTIWTRKTREQAEAQKSLNKVLDQFGLSLQSVAPETLSRDLRTITKAIDVQEAALASMQAKLSELGKEDINAITGEYQKQEALVQKQDTVVRKLKASWDTVAKALAAAEPIPLDRTDVTPTGDPEHANKIKEVIDELAVSLRTTANLEKLLGDSFDESAEKADIYRNAVTRLLDLNVSLNAVVGPQGEKLSELARKYLDNEAAAKRTAEAERELARAKEDAKAATQSLLTPLEKYNAEQARLKGLLDVIGPSFQETYTRGLAAAKKAYDETTPAGKRYVQLLEEQKRVLGSIQTPMQAYEERVALLNELLKTKNVETGKTLITQEQFNAGMVEAEKALANANRSGSATATVLASVGEAFTTLVANLIPFTSIFGGEVGKINDEMAQLRLELDAGQISQSAYNARMKELSAAMAQAQLGASKLGQAFRSFAQQAIQEITRVLARLLVFRAALAIFGGGPLSKLFGDTFLGFRIQGNKALGGPVMRNRAYFVGERGPELFVPRTTGNIVPNNRIGSGSNTLRLDFSNFPAARNPLASARDDEWMNFLKESLLNAYEDGHPVLQRG